jgi:calcineurin-like phosphoesterase family protein
LKLFGETNWMQEFFIGDTHFGHKRIMEYEPCRAVLGSTMEEHNEGLIERWNRVVGPNDRVWHLGDVAFGLDALELCGRLNGDKHLIMGNHDHYPTAEYLKYFSQVYGAKVLKGSVLLTHIPIHKNSASRFKINVHGHLHSNNNIRGRKYFNASCENHNFTPVAYDVIWDYIKNYAPLVGDTQEYNEGE